MSEQGKDDSSDIIARDAEFVLRPWADPPIAIVEAKGCTVTDETGKDFLDFTSGYFVNNAGHCHPRIVEAATQQMHKVTQVSGKQTTPPLVDLAERLVKHTPKSIDKVFFTTGGSESSEFAIKMARQYTGKPKIAALENGYHGLTIGALEYCAAEKYRATAGIPMGAHSFFLPTAYCYRCPHQQNCETQCLDEAEKRLEDNKDDTGAIMGEPIQAVGGVIPPEKWWARLDKIRRERGLLLILDEIQTGLGRTGAMFAAEHYGLEPDILSGGKGLSGGIGSLGVATARAEVVADFYGGTTPTSAGNAVSAAAGRELMDVLVDEGLIENCAKMGVYFTEAVADLDDPWVGDIRFKGLLGGVELVLDRETKEVMPKSLMGAVKKSLHEDGMLITVSGLHGNVLRLQPPLCITSAELDRFVSSLGSALIKVRASL